MKLIFFLISLNTAAAMAASAGGHDSHIPWEVIRTQAINLGILLAILIYFITTPLKNSFKAKKDEFLEESLKTEKALKLAEQELAEIKNRLQDLEKNESLSIANADKEAAVQAEKLVVDAKLAGQKIIDDTQLIINAEITKAKNLIREKIITKSMSSTEATLKASTDAITKKSEAGFLKDLEQVKA